MGRPLPSIAVILASAACVFAQGPEVAVIPPEPSPEAVKALADTAAAERREAFAAIRKAMEDADRLIAQRKFDAAVKELEAARGKAKNSIGHTDEAKETLREVEAKLVHAYKRWALNLEQEANARFLDKDYAGAASRADAAVKALTDAENIDGAPKADRKEARIKEMAPRYERYQDYRNKTSLDSLDPENKEDAAQTAKLMSQASTLVRNRRFQEAKEKLEQALVINPYNYDAMRMLRLVYYKIHEAAENRAACEQVERISELEWLMSEPVPLVKVSEGAMQVSQPVRVEDRSAVSIESKLDSIMIDHVDFEDATLSAVITHLKKESKRNDPEGVGIGIVLDESIKGDLGNIRTITLNLDDVPLREIIKYLCLSTGLKYVVRRNAIIIGNDSINEMQTRFFTVRASTIKNIDPSLGEAKGGEQEGKMGDDFFDPTQTFGQGADNKAVAKGISSDALKSYFEQRGVQFPEGAKIGWDKRSSRLIVTNTPEILETMDKLIKALDIEQPLILIETKFVEIRQEDLEELGFDFKMWKTPNNGGAQSWAINEFNTPSGVQNGNDYLMRHATKSGTPSLVPQEAAGKLINDLSFSTDISSDEKLNFKFFMFALDQCGKTNVLSAPKVIATSGKAATIKLVRTEYFPKSWNNPEASIVGNDGLQFTPAYPEFGEAEDIGIILEVTPEVGTNRHTISLELHPQVKELTDWTNYSYDILMGQLGMFQATLIMPEIEVREVHTSVKIFNGDTVVLGGLLRDAYSSYDDRVPAFGDVPVIGRLFRSKYTHGEKVNLLIFVTARLLSPEGVPLDIGNAQPNGLFDFRR